MQFYFKAQSQHGHSMLQLAVELARIRSFFGDARDRIRPTARKTATATTPHSAAFAGRRRGGNDGSNARGARPRPHLPRRDSCGNGDDAALPSFGAGGCRATPTAAACARAGRCRACPAATLTATATRPRWRH